MTSTAAKILNDKQLALLLRIGRQQFDGPTGTAAVSAGATLNALVRRGLVEKFGTYDRVEWNKVVATLQTVYLTQKGLELAAAVMVGRAYSALVTDRV